METQIKVKHSKPVPVLPGVSYLPERLEIEMDDEIVLKVEQEFLDFLRSLTELMKLMHALKTKNIRGSHIMPPTVIREIMVMDTTGPRYKAWDKMCQMSQADISPSIENIFRTKACTQSWTTSRYRPALRKEQKKRKVGLENDLIEITGKKTKPLWHLVAMSSQNKESVTNLSEAPKSFCTSVDMWEFAHLLNTNRRPIGRYKDLLMDTLKTGILYRMEIVEAFENLGKYYEVNETSMTHAKAKLCFLVVSLPVWDICQFAMQSAVEYYLHMVLNEPKEKNTLEEWLGTRKLPYLLYPPLTPDMTYLSKTGYSPSVVGNMK